jgi:hypothetical protein
MRVRAQDANGDMTFGQSAANFLADSPQAVAQLVGTRLKLIVGEWFLDVTEGTPWMTQILGVRTQATRDAAIKRRILGTPGVAEISDYSSTVVGRQLTVSCTLTTIYGSTPYTVTL